MEEARREVWFSKHDLNIWLQPCTFKACICLYGIPRLLGVTCLNPKLFPAFSRSFNLSLVCFRSSDRLFLSWKMRGTRRGGMFNGSYTVLGNSKLFKFYNAIAKFIILPCAVLVFPWEFNNTATQRQLIYFFALLETVIAPRRQPSKESLVPWSFSFCFPSSTPPVFPLPLPENPVPTVTT